MVVDTSALGLARRSLIVVVVAGMLSAAGCGPTDDPTAANDGTGSTSMGTDSRPGQTTAAPAIGADEEPVGAGTAVDDEDREEATASTASSSVAGSGEPVAVAPGAAELAAKGFSDFSGRRVGLIASRASVVDGRSVIDLMAESDAIELVAVFAAEHGIRADGGAGVAVEDDVDPVTGLPVHSLYGATRQPTAEMLAGVDVLFFDLQDVGARFYTYTATMGLAMRSAAEAGIPFVVLDRPNPIGGARIGGAVRDDEQESFVGQYPIPSVHGMTAGELALAIKGEGWLDGLAQLDLQVIPATGWGREQPWTELGLAWVPPSPGLPTPEAALVYPATVWFEATTLSFGRGTDHPFQQIGAPWLDGRSAAERLNGVGLPGVRFRPVTFTPEPQPPNGPAAVDPQYEGVSLPGVRVEVTDGTVIEPAVIAVHLMAEVLGQAAVLDQAGEPGPVEVIDRPQFFDLLAGTADTRRSLEAGIEPSQIVGDWQAGLDRFEPIRARYLLY